MPPPRHNVLGAMFDVKPVDRSGSLDVTRIQKLSAKVNLRNQVPIRAIRTSAKAEVPEAHLAREDILKELERSLNHPRDHRTLLAQAGAHVRDLTIPAKPRYRPVVVPTNHEEKHHEHILLELQKSRPKDPQPIESPGVIPAPSLVVTQEHPRSQDVDQWFHQRQRPMTYAYEPKRSRGGYRRIAAGCAAVVFLLGGYYAFGLKDRVIQDGTQAVQELESARENLTNLDFAAASENFLSAYDAFSNAGSELNVLGSTLGSLFAELPGGEKLKSAQNLVEVGKLLADTGTSMASAMDALSRTGLFLNPQKNSNVLLAEVIQPLNGALGVADTNLKKVRVLLGDIDTTILPEDKRPAFQEFTSTFPQLQELVTQGSEFAQFLEAFVSVRGTKRYLVLFQNQSELRPTGGFPGSYAILTFDRGTLKEYTVGDVYDIDGQIKDLFVPPKQLQHITPTWALRDANWFIDFPTSAKKIAAFFKNETGLNADGVITLSPAVFTDLLKIIGPIDMPAYKKTITAENFLATVQAEVEYGPNKELNKPKQIILDMAPIVMERLMALDHARWLDVINALIGGLEQKHVLMNFRDLNLQSFARDKGFSGEIKETTSDYVMVTLTNVKGSKTDIVTDTVVKMGTHLENGRISHTLAIGRTHNGGKTAYGFYNKQNPAFVRVLVPNGSTLTNISGHSIPGYRPLVEYDPQFKIDPDLAKFESTFAQVRPGVWTYQENGKTGFAFWLITDPGSSRTVELAYAVPQSVVTSNYSLYIQRQPGLQLKNFHFELSKPDSISIADSMPGLNKVGNLYTFSGKLDKDLLVTIDFQ